MAKNQQLLRIGAIGAGGMMHGLVRGLLEMPGVEIAALVDPLPQNIERLQKAFPATAGAATYADYRRMLDAGGLDAVVISSPHTAHFSQIMDALDAGLHVLCEKPMVCSVADCRKVIAKAKATRHHVVVGYQRRFMGNYRCLREFVRDKAFGKPLFMQAFQSQYWYQRFLTAWRTDPKLSGGGQINDSGSHLVDMLFWILPDQPVEVTAFMHNRGTRVDVDSAISFRCAGGCLGNISINGSSPRMPGWWEDITIIGDAGRAIFLRNGVVTLSDGRQLLEVKRTPSDRNKCHHFVDVVRGQAKNESPPEEFMPTIAFTEACWKSAAAGGKPIRVAY